MSKRINIGWLAFLVVLSACGVDDAAPTEDPNESFLAQMGSADGKADAIIIDEGSPEALGILAVANELDFEQLDDDVSLDRRAAESIIVYRQGDVDDPNDDRDFDSLDELDQVAWVGMRAFRKMYDYASANGFIDRFRQPVIDCTSDDQCGDGAVCHFSVCADVVEIPLGADTEWASFGVSGDGDWWVRDETFSADTYTDYRGRDQLETTESGSYAENVGVWYSHKFAHLPDGELTALSKSYTKGLIPEFGEAFENPDGANLWNYEYAPDGTLYVVTGSKDDASGNDVVRVHRQTVLGWRVDFTHEVALPEGDYLTTALTFARNGTAQLWVDFAGSASRYDRAAEGDWQLAFEIDQAAAGFGDSGWNRLVEFEQRNPGVVHIQRERFDTDEPKVDYLRVVDDQAEASLDLTSEPYVSLYQAVTADDTILADDGEGNFVRIADGVRTSHAFEFASNYPAIRTDDGGDVYIFEEGNSDAQVTILRPRE